MDNSTKKRLDIITIFPEYFDALKISLLGKSIENGVIDVNVINLRDFADSPHFNVDDRPYGGGAGMVMRVDILAKAIDSCASQVKLTSSKIESNISTANPLIIFTSAAGEKFTQKFAEEFALPKFNHIIFICGRFEGYDSRIIEYTAQKYGINTVLEMSIGDFVLFGGEVAVITMIEAISRLIPGVIGNPESLIEESHNCEDAYLEYPTFTRPQSFAGLDVPDVLLSGDHAKIATWRAEQSDLRTKMQNSRNIARKN